MVEPSDIAMSLVVLFCEAGRLASASDNGLSLAGEAFWQLEVGGLNDPVTTSGDVPGLLVWLR